MALTQAQKAKKNYNYGKLENGTLVYAPYYLVIGKRCYINANASQYLSQGWKVIRFTELPEDASEEIIYREVYSEDETTIYSDWVLVENED